MNIISADSLMTHNGMQFSTRDEDHDTDAKSCSVKYHGSWWYFHCHDASLNGRYYEEGKTGEWGKGIIWQNWTGDRVSLKTVTMQMRPAGFAPGEEFIIHHALL